jgi:hypothetical protein
VAPGDAAASVRTGPGGTTFVTEWDEEQ